VWHHPKVYLADWSHQFVLDIIHSMNGTQMSAIRLVFGRLLVTLAAAAVLCGSASPAFAQRPPELKGKPAKQTKQNQAADDYDLTRMSGPSVIRRLVKQGYLVKIPRTGSGYFIDPKLGRGYRSKDVLVYARPWVKKFLDREGSSFAKAFGGARFKVSSLIRTEDYQSMLTRKNVNAAKGKDWRTQSAHLTGAALDISKRGLSPAKVDWMRQHLVALERAGWVIAVEEMKTNTFHIFVQPVFGNAAPGAKSSE
jgi:hypothetical protein